MRMGHVGVQKPCENRVFENEVDINEDGACRKAKIVRKKQKWKRKRRHQRGFGISGLPKSENRAENHDFRHKTCADSKKLEIVSAGSRREPPILRNPELVKILGRRMAEGL